MRHSTSGGHATGGSPRGCRGRSTRYQAKTDKASHIVNDPNDWSREHGQPRYIIDLLKRIVTASIATMEIVDRLPELDIIQ